MIERYKLQNNFDQLGTLQAHMSMDQDSSSLNEFNEIQKSDIEKVNGLYQEQGNSKRSLRGSIMKQQLSGGKGSFGRSNSMLDELKNIQQEIKLKRQMTSDFSSQSDNQEQNKSNNDHFSNQISHDIQSKPSFISKDAELSSEIIQTLPLDQSLKKTIDNTHPNINTLEFQISDSDGYKINNLNLFAQSSINSQSNGLQNSADNSFVNVSDKQLCFNTINNHKVNQNDLEEEQNHSNIIQEFPSLPQNLGFIHKQIKGVLEQEGYIVEESVGQKQLEQLHSLESQRQMIKQASIDYNKSKERFQFQMNEENVDQDISSEISQKAPLNSLKGKGQYNHIQKEKENKKYQNPSKYKNMNQVDRRKSEGNQYLSFSERNIKSISELKEKLEQSHERRHSVSEQAENDNIDKRSLLRKNVFLTNAITKSPCQSGNLNGEQINVQSLDDENQKNENPKSQREIEIIYQNEGTQKKEGNLQLESFLKKQNSLKSEEIDKQNQYSSRSCSSSASSLSENETERRISSLNNRSLCGGGESSRNRSMRMNIGWGSATKNKNDSSEGDDEDDNNSEKQYSNKDPNNLLMRYQTFSKRGTVDLDQEEQEGREKVKKINLYEYENNYQNESDGDDEDEERSEDNDRGSSTAKNENSNFSKFQKYYTQNNNFQFDSIEEMESSQESIKKSTTKNSWKAKYPGTTRSMPKTDHPSSFYQYMNMRKSRKRKSNIAESTDDFQQDLERNEQSGVPENNFSGCIDGIDESITDLNINLDQSYNLKNSLHKSQTFSAQNSSSKQIQTGNAFQFNLNQVKNDPLLNNNLLGFAKLAESKSNSPKSDIDKSEENKKDQILNDNIPSMMGLPNSSALINNYFLKDFTQEFIYLKNNQQNEKEKNTEQKQIEEQIPQVINVNKIQDQEFINLENNGQQQDQLNINKQLNIYDTNSQDTSTQTQKINNINVIQENDNQQTQSLFTVNINPQQINIKNQIINDNDSQFTQSIEENQKPLFGNNSLITINKVLQDENKQLNPNLLSSNSPQLVNTANIQSSKVPDLPNSSDIKSLSPNLNQNSLSDKTLKQQLNLSNQSQISTSLFTYEGNSNQINSKNNSFALNISPTNISYNNFYSNQQQFSYYASNANSMTVIQNFDHIPHTLPKCFAPSLTSAGQTDSPLLSHQQNSCINDLSSPINLNKQKQNNMLTNKELEEIKPRADSLLYVNLLQVNSPSVKTQSSFQNSFVLNNDLKFDNFQMSDSNLQQLTNSPSSQLTNQKTLDMNGLYSQQYQQLNELKKTQEKLYPQNDIIFEDQPNRVSFNGLSLNGMQQEPSKHLAKIKENSELIQNLNTISQNSNQFEDLSLENGIQKLLKHQSSYQFGINSQDRNSINIPHQRLSLDQKYLNDNNSYKSDFPSSAIQKTFLESSTNFSITTKSESEIERSKYIENILSEYRKKMSFSSSAANNSEAKQIEASLQNTFQLQDNLNQSKDTIQNISCVNTFTNINLTSQDLIPQQTSVSHNILSNLSVNNQSYLNLDNDLKNSFQTNIQHGSNLMLSSFSQKNNFNMIGLQKSISHAYNENFDEKEQSNQENSQQNCEKYTGEYKDNQKHGYGQLIYPDGKSFVGNFLNDKKDGFGQEYETNKKLFYQGEFKDDLHHGYGIYYNDISQQSQNIINHENLSQIENQWIQYDGQFMQGIKQGKGKIKFYNNDVYDGYLSKNIPEGYGEFIYSHGKIVKGVWNNGVFKNKD